MSAAVAQEHSQVLGQQALAEGLAEAVAVQAVQETRQPAWEPGLCALCLLPLDLFPALPSAPWLDGRPCLVQSLLRTPFRPLLFVFQVASARKDEELGVLRIIV